MCSTNCTPRTRHLMRTKGSVASVGLLLRGHVRVVRHAGAAQDSPQIVLAELSRPERPGPRDEIGPVFAEMPQPFDIRSAAKLAQRQELSPGKLFLVQFPRLAEGIAQVLRIGV